MGPAVAISTCLALLAALLLPSASRAQSSPREDLSPCTGSAPEPGQTAEWSVAFCNRTGHDLVIEFHDNECPIQNGGRRGDVYQRTLRRGESRTLPLCYANESASAKAPAPGVPMLRIPGGKGVVTTWSVVGDCGERSKSLNLDARSFYDRGDFRTGIILLQYPASASHCFVESAGEQGAGAPAHESAAAAAALSSPSVGAQSAVAPHGPTAALQPTTPLAPVSSGTGAPAASGAAVAPSAPVVNSAPALKAAIDTQDSVGRTVRVFANGTGAPGYKCNFTLELQFTDGAGWNDFVKTTVTGAEGDRPVITRKYLKSVTRAELKSLKCSPL